LPQFLALSFPFLSFSSPVRLPHGMQIWLFCSLPLLLEPLRIGKTMAPAQDIEDLCPTAYHDHTDDYHSFTGDELADIRNSLLEWYDLERRKLPWRGDEPPWNGSTAIGAESASATTAKQKGPKGSKQETLDAFFKAGSASMKSSGQKAPPQKDGRPTPIPKLVPLSPYGTWVSEVMLQQTRVDTVIDYYTRWMELFPTVQDLAAADLNDVNTVWAGLGYYRRAKLLHEGAKTVVSEYEGTLPSTVKELLGIPGIGPYTAGAIASIAHGKVEPLVDGNVIRVLSRLRAIASDPKQPSMVKLCWQLAGLLVDTERPGDFNQGLMELGATLCRTQTPRCGECPLRTACKTSKLAEMGGEAEAEAAVPGCSVCATGKGVSLPIQVGSFPLKAPKVKAREQLINVTVITKRKDKDKDTEFLMVRRPPKGLLAGQWEFPSVMLNENEAPEDFPLSERRKKTVEVMAELRVAVGLKDLKKATSLGRVVHVFSHLRHTMLVESVALEGVAGKAAGKESKREIRSICFCLILSTRLLMTIPQLIHCIFRWMTKDEMGQVGITTGMKKVL
ncbi:unnamed protein product, partial [Chrysoparadoxa australica]